MLTCWWIVYTTWRGNERGPGTGLISDRIDASWIGEFCRLLDKDGRWERHHDIFLLHISKKIVVNAIHCFQEDSIRGMECTEIEDEVVAVVRYFQ